MKVPASGTRPTSDRVREALFSSLGGEVDFAGLRVLDLYAGSGALGLEALSRGASEVVLVDSAATAVKVIAENVRTVGLPGARTEKCEVVEYLRTMMRPFDLVFLDPPYDVPAEQVQDVLADLVPGWLAPGAIVVVERGDDPVQVRFPPGFEQHWNRRFGGTHVLRAVWYGHDQ